MRVITLSTVVALAACGGGAAPTEPVGPTERAQPTRRVIEDTSQDEGDDGMEVVSTRGHMEPGDIEAGIAPHSPALEACYVDGLKKRRWLGGKVQLTWQITRDGQVTSVALSESDLGDWAIEKCLLGVARTATFAKPKGGDADFSLPLEFTARGASVWWDEEVSAKAVGKRVELLAKCDEAAKPAEEIVITMYVGTRGKVQTVGFASAGAVPEAWADCASPLIAGWTLADPRGRVAKASVRYRAP